MIIWLILIAMALSCACLLALAAANAKTFDETRAAYKRNGMYGVPVGCAIPVLAYLIVGLWTWYAIDVSDWRFAAIAWMPIVTNLIAKAATSRARST